MYCDHEPIFYLWGRIGQLSHRFVRCQVIITHFRNLKIIWTPGSNLAFPDTLSRNVTIDENQHHQLQHKKLPRDIQFFDENGQQVTYKNSNDDTTADTCNDFYPILCQQGKDQNVLRLHNDGEKFSLNSLTANFDTSSVQLAADCFRRGKAKNQFRRLCQPQSPVSLSPSEKCNGTYNSISVIEEEEIEELGSFLHTELVIHEDCDTDEDEVAFLREINANDHCYQCKARAAHDLVPSTADAGLAKKPLSATVAPQLRTQDLMTLPRLSILMSLPYYSSNSKTQCSVL